MAGTIDRLIINSPYEEPTRHWRYDRETRNFDLVDGRRPAGYVVASGDSKAFDDPGIFVEIPLVNQIRPRVKAWRQGGYPGVSSVTKRLLADLTAEGLAVVMLSTEVDEHIELMDRVLVFNGHECSAVLDHAELTREALVSSFFGKEKAV